MICEGIIRASCTSSVSTKRACKDDLHAVFCPAASTDWQSSVRPATAPCQMPASTISSSSDKATWRQARTKQQHQCQQPATALQASAGQQLASMSTQKGVPCHHKSMLVDVDLLTGSPATEHICSAQPWRVARVKSRAVPNSSYGYGEGGKRAQHQSYNYYKYYGACYTSMVDLAWY